MRLAGPWFHAALLVRRGHPPTSPPSTSYVGYLPSGRRARLAGPGVEVDRVAEVWEFDQSDLFSDAERSALRLARDAAQQPSQASPAHFAALSEHFDEAQIIEIVAVISLFGFLNRWNDTLATDLEDE